MRVYLLLAVLAACGEVNATPADAPAGDGPKLDAAADAPLDGPGCTTVANARARWRGEQNVSDSVSVFNGVALGTNFAYTAGKHGQAFSFDGVDDGVSISDNEMLWPNTSFTLEAWVKTSSAAPGIVLSKYACGGACPNGAALSYFALALAANGFPQFDQRPEGQANTATLKDTQAINDGAWHHLVGVRDNTMSKMILYVDGVQRLSSNLVAAQLGPMSDADASVDPVTIGTSQVAGQTTYGSYLTGAVDEVAIYSRALSAAEVAAIYAAPAGICP